MTLFQKVPEILELQPNLAKKEYSSLSEKQLNNARYDFIEKIVEQNDTYLFCKYYKACSLEEKDDCIDFLISENIYGFWPNIWYNVYFKEQLPESCISAYFYCVNDYLKDIAIDEEQEEYKRIAFLKTLCENNSYYKDRMIIHFDFNFEQYDINDINKAIKKGNHEEFKLIYSLPSWRSAMDFLFTDDSLYPDFIKSIVNKEKLKLKMECF